MNKQFADILAGKLDSARLAKLEALANEHLVEFLADAVKLCQPDSVTVFDDSKSDVQQVRRLALETREEKALATDGHTYHFDGMQDQGRDQEVTRYLVPADQSLSKTLN